MSPVNDATTIHGIAGTLAEPTVRPAAGGEAPGFQALLERLQQLAAAPRSAAPVETADDLRSAMRDADASFTTAMDLRRQLEEAFRHHRP